MTTFTVGGMRFVQVGRLGASFYVKKGEPVLDWLFVRLGFCVGFIGSLAWIVS